MNKNKSNEILQILKEIVINPRCELNYNNPFELLIATILSAQTKDQRVNLVTGELFQKYPNPLALAKADIEIVKNIIKPLGLYEVKANTIINVSNELVNKFNSEVPNTLESLMSLSGVGRKTASVVLVEAFKIPAVPVDTHVLRVAKRLGYTKSENPIEVEADIKRFVPKNEWIISHHLFIHFGRYTCLSKSPKCKNCKLASFCKKER